MSGGRLHSTIVPTIGHVTYASAVEQKTDGAGNITGFEMVLVEYNNTRAFMIASDVGKRRRKQMSAYIKVEQNAKGEYNKYPVTVKKINTKEKYDKSIEPSDNFDDQICNHYIMVSLRIGNQHLKKHYHTIHRILEKYNTIAQECFTMYIMWCRKKEIAPVSKLEFMEASFWHILNEHCSAGIDRQNPEKVIEFFHNFLTKMPDYFDSIDKIIPEQFIKFYLTSAKKRLRGESTISKKFVMQTIAPEGVLDIRKFFTKAKEYGGTAFKIETFTIPYYIVTTKSNDEDEGKKNVTEFVNSLKKLAKEYKITIFDSTDSRNFMVGTTKYSFAPTIDNRVHSNIIMLKEDEMNSLISEIV